jgi:dihydroxyacetone kinase
MMGLNGLRGLMKSEVGSMIHGEKSCQFLKQFETIENKSG